MWNRMFINVLFHILHTSTQIHRLLIELMLYRDISGYLGIVESFGNLDKVCKDSHGLDVRRDPNRMLQLGYNDIFMEIYTYYDSRDITMIDDCTSYYIINPDVNSRRYMAMYSIQYI